MISCYVLAKSVVINRLILKIVTIEQVRGIFIRVLEPFAAGFLIYQFEHWNVRWNDFQIADYFHSGNVLFSGRTGYQPKLSVNPAVVVG